MVFIRMYKGFNRLNGISDCLIQACWSADGAQIYAGRRNGSVDAWDVRQLGISGPGSTPRLLKTLRNPLSSGVVSCVVAFPDSKHIAWWVGQTDV